MLTVSYPILCSHQRNLRSCAHYKRVSYQPVNAAALSARRAFSKVIAKLRLIALSDLSVSGKFRYAFDTLVRRLWPHKRNGTRRYRLTCDRSIQLRESSTDWNVFEEIFIERIYDRHAAVVSQGARPVLVIDLGANIGLSAIALAQLLRPERIVAVEPDEGNFAMLVENLRLAGLSCHAVALHAFAGAQSGFAELQDSGYGAWGMRMGPAATSGIPMLTLAHIVARAGPAGYVGQSKVILKCDIEGSERQLFEQMHTWERLVDFVILELHTEFLPAAEFRAHLEASRYEWRMHGEIPPGAVLAVFGLERLREKPEALSQGAG